MGTILEINNWEQLTRARSTYSNLRIAVDRYNSQELIGTKITILDTGTKEIYTTMFAVVEQSTRFPLEVSFTDQQIVDKVNSFGFNVALSQPTCLAQNVVTILQGLYEGGYRYIYKDYPKGIRYPEYTIIASDQINPRLKGVWITKMPGFVPDEWEWCKAFKSYPIQDLLNGTVDNGNGL